MSPCQRAGASPARTGAPRGLPPLWMHILARQHMQPPPIGANLWIWESPVTTDVVASLAPHLAGWSFDVIELPLEQPGDWGPAEVRPILDEHDLRPGVCAVMAPGRDLTTSDRGIVEATQAY